MCLEIFLLVLAEAVCGEPAYPSPFLALCPLVAAWWLQLFLVLWAVSQGSDVAPGIWCWGTTCSLAFYLMPFCKAANIVWSKSWRRKNVTAISISLWINFCKAQRKPSESPSYFGSITAVPRYCAFVLIGHQSHFLHQRHFSNQFTLSHFQKPLNLRCLRVEPCVVSDHR